jgi:PAS domain S-box-containing protein
MKKSLSNALILRQKAEDLINKKVSKSDLKLSDIDTLKFIHELQVHQIELEMINQELVLAQEAAKRAVEKYADLYDFAPMGYFTLSKEGRIVELNLLGAQMLGKERSRLKGIIFNSFISDDTKSTYSHFLQKLFDSQVRENCEVTLCTSGNSTMYVYITGIKAEKEEQYLLTAVDITERTLAEIALKEKMNELKRFHSLVIGRELRMIELKKEVNELLRKSGLEEKYLIG